MRVRLPPLRGAATIRAMKRLGVIGSGSGSNFQAILDAIDRGELDAEVACVLSDVAEARILDRARERGIPACYVDGAPYRTKLAGRAEQAVIAILSEHRTDYVVLAGFMRMVKDGLLGAYPRRILNIHPSLLPAFPGLASWEQALTYGVRYTGCTVHFVDVGMDTGPIIVQKTVPIHEEDTPSTLHARIQEQEHIAYPEALQLVLAGRTRVDGRRVRTLPE